MSDKITPADKCIEYINKRIEELGYEGHTQFDAFAAGIELGLEAGIKQMNGDFAINNSEEDETDQEEKEDD